MHGGSISSLFSSQDLSLIVKSDPEETSQTVPRPFYLIMPSSNSTLLMKSIAVEELILPSDFPSLAEKTSQESTEIIQSSLDLVRVGEM